MESDPFALVEAMTIAAYATGCTQGFVYVRAEYPLAHERLGNAIAQARAAGLLEGFDVELRIGAGGDATVAPAVPEAAHEEALTRPTMTASVHYVRFGLTPVQVERFAEGPVVLAVVHREYRHETTLGDETRRELATDLVE